MIECFQVRNFKSFVEARLVLRPLTVLIGANASGKTNLLEALQLLSWMAEGRQLGQLLSAIRVVACYRDPEAGLLKPRRGCGS